MGFLLAWVRIPVQFLIFKLWFIGLFNLVGEIVVWFKLVFVVIFLVAQECVTDATGIDVEDWEVDPREGEYEPFLGWCM